MYNQHKIAYLDHALEVLEEERIKRHNLAMFAIAIQRLGIADELYEEWERRFGKFDNEEKI